MPVVKPSKPTAEAPLRLVLFGRPGSGKSSLVGALARAAQSQQTQLGGQFVSLAEGFTRLQKHQEANRIPPTGEEIVAYPAAFQARGQEQAQLVEILDCDGRTANELLTRREMDASHAGQLTRSLLAADAIILTVDSAAPTTQLDSDFAAFLRFLGHLEEGRGRRTDASGLPVFLVLTKCDRLASPSESFMDWLDRVEQRKREVEGHFRDFLAREAADGGVPFGQVTLHLWATAVSTPALARVLPSPEPFGVAELFRQARGQANAYRARRAQAGRRLRWTVGSAAGLVTLLLGLAIGLAVQNYDRPRSELEVQLDALRSSEPGTVAARLRAGPFILKKRRAQLDAIQNHPQWSSLPIELRDYVLARIDEIDNYLDYYQKLNQLRRPEDVTSQAALTEARAQLANLEHPPEWANTPAALHRATMLADLDRLEKAAAQLARWYREEGGEARALRTFKDGRIPDTDWAAEVRPILAQTDEGPFAGQEYIPDSRAIRPAQVAQFDTVTADRLYWQGQRQRLKGVRDLAAALDLLGPGDQLPAALVIPAPFDLKTAGHMVEELTKAYPDFQRDFGLSDFPQRIRQVIARHTRTQYQRLLAAGQDVVRQKLRGAGPGLEETPAAWQAVGDWLKNPTEQADWHTLAAVLARLQGLPDPLQDLQDFLQKSSFTIQPAGLVLKVPEDFGPRLPGNAALSLTCTRAGTEPQTMIYRRQDDKPDGYTFVREEGKIDYLPGDDLTARLPLLNNEVLSWIDARSPRYQFECLSRPPRLHHADQTAKDGLPQKRISLAVTEASQPLPRVPDLVPPMQPD
jgi:hypothetical protein